MPFCLVCTPVSEHNGGGAGFRQASCYLAQSVCKYWIISTLITCSAYNLFDPVPRLFTRLYSCTLLSSPIAILTEECHHTIKSFNWYSWQIKLRYRLQSIPSSVITTLPGGLDLKLAVSLCLTPLGRDSYNYTETRHFR